MEKYKFSDLTVGIIRQLVSLEEKAENWEPKEDEMSEKESNQILFIKERLQDERITLMNEATVWDRAIYPLLFLSEQKPFITWSQVPLSASYKSFSLEGFVDGVIGMNRAGQLALPYLVIIEGKKGLEAKNPQPQLYGAMLAAAKLNWEEDLKEPQKIYGCYTISDSWTFVSGTVSKFDELPSLGIQSSREYFERLEADTILKILKAILKEK
jgi:hypothetical protein